MLAVFSVQAEEVKYSFSSYSTGTQYAQGEKHILDENVTLVINGAHLNTQVRLYAGSNAVFESKKGITKVVLTAGNKAGTLTVNVSNDGSAWTKVKEQSTTTSYTAYTFDLGGSYKYVQMASTGAQIRVSIATLTFSEDAGNEGEGGETPEPEQPETPVAPAAPTLTASCNFDNSMIVEIANIAEGATAYYSLNSEANWVAGTSVTITETTTVYAKVVKDELSSDVVSATYTKNEPVTPPAEGEVVDVLNRALTGVTSTSYSEWSGKTVTSTAVYAGQSAGGNESIQLRSNNSNSGIVTTTSGGKVKKVVVEWNSNTSNDRTLNVYGKNSAYTAATDLYNNSNQGTLLGTIVKGTSTVFEIDGDYEYIGVRSASGAMYLTSISITWDASAGVTPVAPAAPVLTESQTFKGSLEVTITSNATVYYTTDGTTPSAANGTEYTAPFEITATTTVKAVAVNEVGASEVAEATYTLFVVEETEGYYVKVTSEPADWTGKYLIVYEEDANAYVFNGKDEVNGYVAAKAGSVIKADGELDAVAVTVAAMQGGYSIKTADGYIAGITSKNGLVFGAEEALNTLECSADGVAITSNGSEFRFNDASNQMRFRYYANGQKPVQLYKYTTEAPSYELSVSAAGWATLFLNFAATIPAEVEAYAVTTVNDGYVTLTQVKGALPANTGVVVKASMGEYEFVYTDEPVEQIADNKLKGSAVATNVTEEAYVLGIVEGEVGLYKAEMAGGVWLNNANKAYLPASVASGAASYSFRFEGATTAIENVVVENASNVIFDLTGRKVEAISAPGIYVVNGKKVLVK